MKSFRERNRLGVTVSVLSALLLLSFGAFSFERIPVIGAGPAYYANFTEAAGLRPDDEVLVSGVKVGEVSDVDLEGEHVRVTFRARGIELGDQSRASIRIRTLLGQKYLHLQPRGEVDEDTDPVIPLERTVTPYDVNEAFTGLTDTLEEIDTRKLGESFRTLSETFRDSPPVVRSTLDGLSRLSETLASRDEELSALVSNTRRISTTVAERNAQFEALLTDGNLLLDEVRQRREAISALLTGTRELAAEISGLVADHREQLRPALEQLGRVTEVLQRNQDKLDESLRMAGPFYRMITDAVSNGPWIDVYVCGLIPSSEENRDCAPPRTPGGNR